MPPTLSVVCLAAATAFYWQQPERFLRVADCAAEAVRGWVLPSAPGEPVPEPVSVPPVIEVRRPLEDLPPARQFVHELAADLTWRPELIALVLVLCVFVLGCTCGFCCRRCLELPALPTLISDGAGGTSTDSRRMGGRDVRGRPGLRTRADSGVADRASGPALLDRADARRS